VIEITELYGRVYNESNIELLKVRKHTLESLWKIKQATYHPSPGAMVPRKCERSGAFGAPGLCGVKFGLPWQKFRQIMVW